MNYKLKYNLNYYKNFRVTIFTAIGNFIAANFKALIIKRKSVPANSYKIRPGFTLHTQNATLPLPLPIRTSLGLFVTGKSGKIRIQTLPFLFKKLVIERLTASICFAVIRPFSID